MKLLQCDRCKKQVMEGYTGEFVKVTVAFNIARSNYSFVEYDLCDRCIELVTSILKDGV